MPQPVSYTPYFHLTGTAAGTVQVLTHIGNFDSVTVGTTTTGTATLYDSSGTAMGTPGYGLLMTVLGTPVGSYKPQVGLKAGIVAVVSGTVDMLVSCG